MLQVQGCFSVFYRYFSFSRVAYPSLLIPLLSAFKPETIDYVSSYKIELKQYSRPFKEIIHSAHGIWRNREGAIIRMQNEAGETGYGEIAPLPAFGTETLEDAVTWFNEHESGLEDAELASIPNHLRCVQFALSSAKWMIHSKPDETYTTVDNAALLAPGFRCLKGLMNLIEAGYTVFKIKVGMEIVTEQVLIREILNLLPEGSKLRIDANGSMNLDTARLWMKVLDEYDAIEYFEQPLPPGEENDMRLLAKKYQTPIALDESVSSFRSLLMAHESRWPGPLIVKPAILGPIDLFKEWRKCERPNLVYSSVFETAIGFHSFLELATSDPRDKIPAIGGATLEYFNDDNMQLYRNSARLNRWNYTTSDFTQIWDQL